MAHFESRIAGVHHGTIFLAIALIISYLIDSLIYGIFPYMTYMVYNGLTFRVGGFSIHIQKKKKNPDLNFFKEKMMFLCNWGYHKWNKWTDAEILTVRARKIIGNTPISDWEERRVLSQHRSCLRCNLLDRRVFDPSGRPYPV